MAEDNTLTLNPLKHDKLGIIHCGVITDGRITCGGDLKNIEDGEEVTFERVKIKAKRNGNEYTFTRM